MNAPHSHSPIMATGAPLSEARAAMVMVHGRGAGAQGILPLAAELQHPDFAYLAPQAAGGSWYPNSFLAPIPSNEPGISRGMDAIDDVLSRLDTAGVPAERTILLGFSQGGCLALEYAARHARRYGGIIALSGGLIGPDGTPRDYAGSLDGTPVFLGCSDVDFHIPAARVELSAEVMRRLGGEVAMRLYPGMGHTVNEDELEQVRAIMAEVG